MGQTTTTISPHKTLGIVAKIVVDEPSGFGDDPADWSVPDDQHIVGERSVPFDQFESE